MLLVGKWEENKEGPNEISPVDVEEGGEDTFKDVWRDGLCVVVVLFEGVVLLPSFLVGLELEVSRCDGVLLLLGETNGCVVVGKREHGGDGLFDKVEEGRRVCDLGNFFF